MTTDDYKQGVRAAVADFYRNQEAERLGKRKPPRQIGKSEHEEQAELARWLMDHQISHVAIPNAGQRSFRQASRLRSEGMQKGFPDLLVLTPPPSQPGARGVAIEMKRFHGGRLSVEQYGWLQKLNGLGWVTHVAEGATDAVCFLEGLGYGR